MSRRGFMIAPEYWLWLWCGRHRRWLAAWTLLAVLWWLAGDPVTALVMVGVALAPGVVGMVWVQLAPESYSAWIADPLRRWGWRRRIRRDWSELARVCGLAEEHRTRRRDLHGRTHTRVVRTVPGLRFVRTRGDLVWVRARCRPGQTVEELAAGGERLAATLDAVTQRTYPVSGSVVEFELVMRDGLAVPADAAEPDPARVHLDAIRLGRTQAGGHWSLPLRGRHTLVAGCSGAGKGSVLWGICGGLAPAVKSDLVRLWGVDLKRGVELSMGEGLFSARAYTPDDALAVLRELLRVIDERGAAMVGRTRLHQPTAGDPLHVLVIDELAALTAYADMTIRREANRLLPEILTQGRALGVVVVACVQDPRKDVVAMRGLFTQTVALRLRSVEETAMVLGDGMARTAPAHRIPPHQQGTAWVVEDTGAADRVRTDYWPDDLVQHVAASYPAPVLVDLTPAPATDDGRRDGGHREDVGDGIARPAFGASPPGSAGGKDAGGRRERSPRKPRSPRRSTTGGSSDSGVA